MTYDYDDLDDETLAKAAREALERPSDAAFWDDRLYTSHGAVLSWAERGDDILAESNYLSVLAHLQGVAVWDDRDAQETPDEYVIDATCSHWLVGSLRTIYVKVYEDNGEYTHVFREATAIALSLKYDYPVFDESDFSEREWKEHERQLDEALDNARRRCDVEVPECLSDVLDEDHLHKVVLDRILLDERDDLLNRITENCYPDVDWDEAERVFTEVAERIIEAELDDLARMLSKPGEDQLALV